MRNLSVFTFSLVVFLTYSCAFATDGKEFDRRFPSLISDNGQNRDVSFLILDYLDQGALNSLAKVNKSSRRLVNKYRATRLKQYLSGVNNPNLLQGQTELGPLSRLGKDHLRKELMKRLRGVDTDGKQMVSPGFVFLARGSGLNGLCLSTLQRVTDMTNLISDDQLKTICEKLFGSDQPHGITAQTVSHYLPFHLYTKEGQNFNRDLFMQNVEALQGFKPLVYFNSDNLDEQFLQKKSCEIVIEDKDLETNFDKLQKILNDNPNHVVTLNLDDQYLDDKGKFHLYSQDLPNNIRHLRLIDKKGKIVSIRDAFLYNCFSLENFDSSGLTSLKNIGDAFLYNCFSLKNFDTSGLTSLKLIGGDFLLDCTSLTSFDSSSLTSLEHIGGDFLYNCFSLKNFDTSGLTSLKQIRGDFLRDCTSLTNFDSSGLTSLEYIRGDFLYNCTSLTNFDSSGLTSLENIRGDFLHNCTSLPPMTAENFIAKIKNQGNE